MSVFLARKGDCYVQMGRPYARHKKTFTLSEIHPCDIVKVVANSVSAANTESGFLSLMIENCCYKGIILAGGCKEIYNLPTSGGYFGRIDDRKYYI